MMMMMISSQLNFTSSSYNNINTSIINLKLSTVGYLTSSSSSCCCSLSPRIVRVRLRCQQQIQTPLPSPPIETEEQETEKEQEAFHYPSKEDRVEEKEEEDEDEGGISRIEVPRQKYISVSKSELLAAILSEIIDDDIIAHNDFTRFSQCLDSIIHAEHKTILEDMRTHYHFPSSSSETQETFTDSNINKDNFNFNLLDYLRKFQFFLKPTTKTTTTTIDTSSFSSADSTSIAVASRFQRAFLKLLQDAQFEELSVRDLLLTSALNSDYLLTLPIYVDWKRASDSNAIIFRRGYATERQKGFLIVEKLDYLQSKILQGIFFSLSKPLGQVAMLIKEAFESASQRQELQIWIERVNVWLKKSFSQQTYSDDVKIFDSQLESNQLFVSDLPIWLAAQRAVPRYKGLLSSVGPRGRLLRKFLTWIGLLPSAPKTSLELNSDNTTSEPYLRPSFLSRITLGDIWRPATKEYCGNDFLKMLKTAISILFSQSTLQEPAFQELILLYNEEQGQRKTEYKAQISSLKLKIYERIPIPDLPVVFPDKKLSFRILDTLRLDLASILGLLAFFLNYKFEDILSSPSAVLLDAIAVSAFVLYLSRLALGYKQTWDRYQDTL